jgi:m7GpppX diphosphatase
VRETAELYAAAHEPRIAAIPASNVAWVHNILALEKETDRLLLDVPGDDGFLINTDPKWASHPQTDPSKGPVDRASWKHHACVKDLYCLGLLRRRDVRSIRDLRGEHLPMLRALRAGALEAIHTTYGLPEHSIRAFFHYPPQARAPRAGELQALCQMCARVQRQTRTRGHRPIATSDPLLPQFYHLHVHFTALSAAAGGCNVERAHLLDDVIDNLASDPLYYAKKAITIRVGEQDPLWGYIQRAAQP